MLGVPPAAPSPSPRPGPSPVLRAHPRAHRSAERGWAAAGSPSSVRVTLEKVLLLLRVPAVRGPGELRANSPAAPQPAVRVSLQCLSRAGGRGVCGGRWWQRPAGVAGGGPSEATARSPRASREGTRIKVSALCPRLRLLPGQRERGALGALGVPGAVGSAVPGVSAALCWGTGSSCPRDPAGGKVRRGPGAQLPPRGCWGFCGAGSPGRAEMPGEVPLRGQQRGRGSPGLPRRVPGLGRGRGGARRPSGERTGKPAMRSGHKPPAGPRPGERLAIKGLQRRGPRPRFLPGAAPRGAGTRGMLGHGPDPPIFGVFPQIWCLGRGPGAQRGWRGPRGRAGGGGPGRADITVPAPAF